MDARARSRARARRQRLFRSDREKDRFLHFTTQYRIGAVDFEEQLEHGLGVEKMPPLQIFGLWLYIVKKKISRGNRRGWLDACKID